MADAGPSPIAENGYMHQLRETLSQYFNASATVDLPLLWQNMPLPSPLPDQGWVRFSCQLDRIYPLDLSHRHRGVHGRLTIVVATPKGTGMETSDGLIDQMIRLFAVKSIGAIQLGRMVMDRPRDEQGYHLNGLTIRFHWIDAA
ncbi:MAG: hypothetical protein J4F41_09460 [Alphaproteobacteria bacterium]|nr:hypothetical protein [Alphaproteobacteria bacterium]